MTRILLIDDSKAIHAYVKDLLKDRKVEFEDAFNGKEGVERLKDQAKQKFDLVLLDWEMPQMTGPEVLDQLKNTGYGVPVVMMTSKNAMDDIALVLSKGASEYVMKPFTVDILLEKIETVLGRAVT